MAMAVMGLTTYALLLTQPDLLTSLSLSSNSSSQSTSCSDSTRQKIWSQVPDCRPRQTLVPVNLPVNPNILQVVPNQVSVARCGGSCHTDQDYYQRCSVARRENITVQVLYQVLGEDGGLEEECKHLAVETHTECRCGCQPLQCSSLQEFDSRTCECKCVDRGARGQCLVQYNKMWDSDNCQCKCRPEEAKDCMTGYKYDGVFSCQCLPVPYSAGTPLLVVMGVLVVILIAATVILYTQLKKRTRELKEHRTDMRAERLFPQTSVY